MIKIHFLICLITIHFNISAQRVGIGTNTPDSSAILDVKSSTKGMLIPRTSTTSRLAIANPAKGLMLYDTTTSSFWFHNGANWNEITAGGNGWNLTGNAGTDSALNFIGTTDDKPFHFRLNNLWAGEMHPTNGNIFLGMGAGQSNTTAGKNTAIGDSALQNQSFNYGGETNNVAIGSQALSLNNPTSTGNGISNTAVGSFALRNNTIGYDNTAVGTSALYYNDIGKENTAIGRQALFSNTIGERNTATGYKALRFNNDGSFNTANGYQALYSNTYGIRNNAIGHRALYSNTTGYGNTAIGDEAGNNLPSSYNNTLIGIRAQCSASNSIVIGADSYTNINNLALLGNPTTLFTGGYSTWTNFASDRRLKTEVNEDVKGLDFIMRLRPVTYHLDIRGLYSQWGISPYGKEENKMTAAMKTDMDTNIRNKEAIRMSGFIAQEVEKAAQEAGYDFDGIKKPAHDKDNYGLAYATFVVPLVKAIQELSEQTTEQKKIIEQQQTKIETQQQQYEILLKRVEALEKKK